MSPLTLPVQAGLAGDSSWWVTPLGSQHGYWADPSSHCPIASSARAPRGSASGAFTRKHHMSLKQNQRLGENLETVHSFIRKERARRRSEANELGPVLPPLPCFAWPSDRGGQRQHVVLPGLGVDSPRDRTQSEGCGPTIQDRAPEVRQASAQLRQLVVVAF